ncbi:maleylpyruvate isomerase N-terminal domain-containing protein [Cellulomonas composti]|uniref:Mycothiol-dependent maleylpyruvate isomerase metal-binding domain-containing protein n=1 Tax=Cellulomonas composti TaxID=266130 RepID=A0A511J8C8_9CELL|nr:maleylpyruvate isomerase N-terminal domain-containing protein [Cellulomonas composti]GEL94224.1 hypothetical protein CCO02nite_08820 [Cellulomonas composti]
MTENLPALTFTGTLDRAAIDAATRVVVDLVARPEVAAAWDEPSACEGMSVGALTWHLVNQPQRAVEVIEGHPGTGPVVSVDQHYAHAAWIQQDLDGPANVGVRERGETQALAGPAAAVAAVREASARLGPVLAAAPASVTAPWQSLTLSTDDFLVTRLMEMVVHSDDLAASVGLQTPTFPAAVIGPVVTLLTDLALRRHGQTAVVRTLSRPQRAPESISAF